MFKLWITFSLFQIIQNGLNGQPTLYNDCPERWHSYSGRCYLFESDNPKVFEEADAACVHYGAHLLEVTTFSEHKFVTDWLQSHDRVDPGTWFTGGWYKNGMFLWASDNFPYTGPTYWHTSPGDNSLFTHVGYTYRRNNLGTYQFGWSLVSASLPSNYICEILRTDKLSVEVLERDYDYGQGYIDPSDMEHGPNMIIHPTSVVVMGSYIESVYIECGTNALPMATYTWARDNDTAITSETSARYTLTGGRITFENPNEAEDAGYYHCEASNKFGSILSQPAQLLFGYLGEFSSVKPMDVYARQFEGARLDCIAPAHSPYIRYEWYKWSITDFVYRGLESLFVSNAGYLYFTEVQPTDGKEYFCTVTLSVPQGYRSATSQPPSRTSLSHFLHISGYRVGDYGPIFHTHIFPTPALAGNIVRLECVAYGTLPLFYSWRRENGRPLPAGSKQSDRNRVLTIYNAQLADEGDYICTCKRGVSVTRDEIITLVLEAKPYFVYPLQNMFVDDSSTLRWGCKAVARPTATYTWYKDSKPLQTIPGEIEIVKGVLIIYNLNKDQHDGMYQCGATNVHGTTFSSAELRVLSFIPNFRKHPLPPKTLAADGGEIIIPCRAEGAPEPDIRWYRNNGDLGLLPGQASGNKEMRVDHSLRIAPVGRGDVGTYKCVASNVHGDASNMTVVELVEGLNVRFSPTYTEVIFNTTTFLYCQAEYSYLHETIEVTYRWKFNGRPIDYELQREYALIKENGIWGLHLNRAQYKHEGQYTCEILTTMAMKNFSAQLKVLGPPGEPGNIHFPQGETSKPYSARIIWGPGPDHGDPVFRWTIEVERHYYPDEWEEHINITTFEANPQKYGLRDELRSYLVTDLIPHTRYRFRVRGVNRYGAGLASLPSSSITTNSTVPVQPPDNVGGGEGSVGTLQITWEPLDESLHCADGIGYHVYWKLHSEVDSSGQRSKWEKATVHGNVGKHVETIGADNYFLQYDVIVQPKNNIGDGPNSSVVTIYSAEGLPVAVPQMQDCEQINDSCVTVHWDPVPNDRANVKGRIKGYTILYYMLDVEDYVVSMDLYGADHDTAYIIGLQDNTNYMATVVVLNSAGRGPMGEWRLAETLHLAPHLYPTHIKVKPHGPSSIHVQWRGVSTNYNEETLQGYIVKVWKVTADIRSANETVTEKETETIVYNLQQDEEYQLRILGWSIGGEGSYSETVYFYLHGSGVAYIDPTNKDMIYVGLDGLDAGNHVTVSIFVMLSSLLCFYYFL